MLDRNEKYHKIEVTPELIEKYMRGQLDGKTMHAVEELALDDPFLAEALEGFAARDPGQSSHLASLRRRLNERITVEKKGPVEKALLIRYRNFQIAAAAILLLLIGAGIFFYAEKRPSLVRTVARNRLPEVHLPETVPPVHSGDTPAKPGENDDVSREVTANIPRKVIPGRPADKGIMVPGKKEAPLTPQKPGNKPDTAPVYAAGEKTKIIGSVVRQPASAASAVSRKRSFPVVTGKRHVARAGDSVLLSGRISDTGYRPLAGVMVRVPGTARKTTTDSAGEFRLYLATKPESLRLASIGYQPREIAVNDPAEAVNVSLHPSRRAMQGVVVARYGAGKKRVVKDDASPVGGFAAFRQYLRDSLHYPGKARREHVEGLVKLSFIVMPDSSLRQIKIVSGLGHGCDHEAVRLLREGPRWIPAAGGRPSRQTIRIRFSAQAAGK